MSESWWKILPHDTIESKFWNNIWNQKVTYEKRPLEKFWIWQVDKEMVWFICLLNLKRDNLWLVHTLWFCILLNCESHCIHKAFPSLAPLSSICRFTESHLWAEKNPNFSLFPNYFYTFHELIAHLAKYSCLSWKPTILMVEQLHLNTLSLEYLRLHWFIFLFVLF